MRDTDSPPTDRSNGRLIGLLLVLGVIYFIDLEQDDMDRLYSPGALYSFCSSESSFPFNFVTFERLLLYRIRGNFASMHSTGPLDRGVTLAYALLKIDRQRNCPQFAA
jgi:hypothetical protein